MRPLLRDIPAMYIYKIWKKDVLLLGVGKILDDTFLWHFRIITSIHSDTGSDVMNEFIL